MSQNAPASGSDDVAPQEVVTQLILRRFPRSTASIQEGKTQQVFEIHFGEKLLLILDKKGARYFFPSRRKRIVKWEKYSSLGLARAADYIIRDLAEANYEVVSTTNKPILKRPVHISRLLRCPECNLGGGIKVIVSQPRLAEENPEIYISVSPGAELNGAEIKCALCGWVGIREQLIRRARRRFPK